MANRFARGVGGNWSNNNTWSTTSGGTNDTVAPTNADDVFLDANSGAVTVDSGAVCRSVNCTGYTSTLTHNNGVTWDIGDATAGASNIALKFVSGMTYTPGGTGANIRFRSNSATEQSVDFASKSLGGSLTFGVSGGVGNHQFVAGQTITSTSSIIHNRGTLHLNDLIGTFTQWACTYIDTAPVLNLGSSQMTYTSNGLAFNWSDSGAISLTQGTSLITINGTNARFTVSTAYTFYDLTFSGTGTQTYEGGVACTFHNLTRTGVGASIDKLTLGANMTVSNVFTVTGGAKRYPVRIMSDVVTPRTITCNGTVTAQDAWFENITGAGSASWNLASTRTFASIGVSGITCASYALAETRFNNYQFIEAGDGGSTSDRIW